MSFTDKVKNAAQGLRGKAKVAQGDATGDDTLRTQGQADQSSADLKNAGEKVKDAFGD